MLSHFKCKWTSSSCEGDVSGGVWCSVNWHCFSLYCMWCDWAAGRTDVNICVSHEWLTADHTFKPLCFNVAKTGAGYPNLLIPVIWVDCGHGDIGFYKQGYGWGFVNQGWERLGSVFLLFIDWLSLQMFSSAAMALWWNVYGERSLFATFTSSLFLTTMFFQHGTVCSLMILIPSPAGAFVMAFSFKHLEHKLGIKLFSNILFPSFHYDSIC